MKLLVRSFAKDYLVNLDPWRSQIIGTYFALTTATIFLIMLTVLSTYFEQDTHLFSSAKKFMIICSAIPAFTLKGVVHFFRLFMSAYIVALIGLVLFTLWYSFGDYSYTQIALIIIGASLFSLMATCFTYMIHAGIWFTGVTFRWIIKWSSTDPPRPTLHDQLTGRF